jgi:type I restriction enzyme M protein
MSSSFSDFQTAFFHIYEQPQFGGKTFLEYIARDKSERTGDEASVVDIVLSASLLGLLGFSSGEQVYNAVKDDLSRPDFAPRTVEVGACFIIEDKATGLDLTLDMSDKKSNLFQLAKYVRGAGLSLGLLSNGREMQLWEFDAKTEHKLLHIDTCALLELRKAKKPLDEKTLRPLESLFDLLRREAFTDAKNLAEKLSVDATTWKENAKKLGTDESAEAELVGDLKQLVAQLHREARRQLDLQLDAANSLKTKLRWADDKGDKNVEQAVTESRAFVENALLGFDSRDTILEFLAVYAQDPRPFPSREFFVAHVLELHNQTLTKPLKTLGDNLNKTLEIYAEVVLSIHARQTRLRQKARTALDVEADFTQWKDLVSETMLGDLGNKSKSEADDAQRQEFALQAAYVVFIRLLLIRVCEDKGIFPDRFLSNGGLQFWQQNIKRYLKFVRGNRYEPLLQMAYDNAANIYSHFFTGRELFNWYHLSEVGLLEALSRLAKYDFALIDSDLLGTVYNAYVERHEKKKQGQYYTPVPIVDFILDEVGWCDAQMVGDTNRLIDPACGSGTFLVRAAKRLIDAYRDPNGKFSNPINVLRKVREQIYGFDLNPFACYLAEVNLLIQLLEVVSALPESERRTGLERFHVYNVDALAKPGRGVLSLGHDSLLAEELDVVEHIKTKTAGYENGFSHVVANPPYGAKLSDDYKRALKRDYGAVFRGQPDTYVFFYALSLDLLSVDGRLGFITPNTFLMGTNTVSLRAEMLRAGRIERIVDLPQGIWKDATVDCVLLFLARDESAENRLATQTQVNLMDLKIDLNNTLEKLTTREWSETLIQNQSEWSDDPMNAMDIRRDAIQIAIEAACIVQQEITLESGGEAMQFAPEVLRLGHITDSSQGIIVYQTEAQGKDNLYVRSQRDVPNDDSNWKPLLDTTATVRRYNLNWGDKKPYLKYGNWLWRSRESRFFESPKLVLIRLMNKAVSRRLVASYDNSGFYNRDNFNNIIAKNADYDLKYLLALFNSALENRWYCRKFDHVNINPDTFQQLPIFPADAQTQREIVVLVDALLAAHHALNVWRQQGYIISVGTTGLQVRVPSDVLLAELQTQTPKISTLELGDARVKGHFHIPIDCDTNATVSGVKISSKFPTQISLKFKKLWLEVPDESKRRFLFGLLSRPQFEGEKWSDLEGDSKIRVPNTDVDFARFFEFYAKRELEIRALWEETQHLDHQIDERVLDLYKIVDPAWRTKILDSAPVGEEAESDEVALS